MVVVKNQASSSGVHLGTTFTSITDNTWIIDSGATDHLSNNSRLYDTFTSSQIKSVRVADKSCKPISGSGDVSFSPTLSMNSVLFAPTLSNNLLSISQITKRLNCSVTFYSTHCVFQDIVTKRTIGTGRQRGGLYYLEGAGISMEGDDILLAEVDVKAPPKREEWMTTLPPERRPGGVSTQSTRFSKSMKEGRGDTSAWTDTPSEKAQSKNELFRSLQ